MPHAIDIHNLYLTAIFIHQNVAPGEIQWEKSFLMHVRHEDSNSACDLFAVLELRITCDDPPCKG